MDINALIPEFLVLSLAGSSLSIAAYSSFKDRTDDQKLLLVMATCFILAFLVIFILSFLTSIIGFIIHRLIVDQKFKDDELQSAIDIIESSKDGLDSSLRLFELIDDD
jgi:peptidoglycan biosynthesis protein MviN/MurJ (putative lipid II flippase)